MWKEAFIASFMTLSRNVLLGTKKTREDPRPRKALWDLRFKTESYGTLTAGRQQTVKQVVLSGLPFPKMSVCEQVNWLPSAGRYVVGSTS